MKPDNILVSHYSGSLAYGTNLPTSDVDIRGIFLAPDQGVWTPWSKPRPEIWEDPDAEDTNLTELYKYMLGYFNGSPNVMETLWVNESDIIKSSKAYEYLRSRRSELLSTRLRYSFGGYAFGQMKRIKGHNKWINNPKPEQAPVRKDYFKLIQNFLPDKVLNKEFRISDYDKDHMLIPYGNDIYGIIPHDGNTLFNEDGSIHKVDYANISAEDKKATPKFIVKLNEDVFKTDLEQHKQYWSWKKNRNKTRGLMEEEHGYDAKHAMHVVRLMRMATEILTDGEIQVKRPDAAELLAIRNGAWTYDELLEWAAYSDQNLDKLMKTSDLPNKVDQSVAIDILLKTEEIARNE